MTDEEFREARRRTCRRPTAGKPDGIGAEVAASERLHYVPLDAEDPAAYGRSRRERSRRSTTEVQAGGNVVYYLATAPQLFGPTVEQLGDAGLTTEQDGHWRRVVIEKPFGHDLDSARALNHEILQVLRETQIYRIDHYLGKETVQNILAFRFGNGIFEPIWNRRYIDHVQIRRPRRSASSGAAATTTGSGALRDMVPNHLFQLDHADRDGAADLVRGQRGPRRAGEDAPRHPAVHAGGRAAPHGARAVRGGPGRRAAGSGRTVTSRRCRPIRRPRRSSR